MQSFRERCGFHGNQQNYQPSSQDSSRLENYRHQSHPGLNCVRQRQITKGYYAQGSFQGYENNTGEKYPRGDKHMNVQQLQGRVSFASFPEGNVYPGQYSGEDGLQNWGQSQDLSGTKYEENIIKKTSGEGRGYQDPATQIPFRSHSLHHPQQPNLPYAKLPRQKVQSVQNDVPSSPLSFSQSPHFNQNFPTSTYSSVPGSSPVSHSFKSCTAPSNPPHERAMATAGQRVQPIHGYQSSRMSSYEQTQRHHAQETLHYQNMAKYHGQHYSQQGQAYCQPEAPSRTPEQYYQTFSPSASHSPARSVGRSPSYSSTPSPLMPNIENFQYNQQQHNTNTFPIGISDHSHYMPLLNPSPTGTSSPESQTKNLQNDKIPETLLSDLSLQSLTALTSQVENISNTVQQLLLSKSGIPQKKGVKTSPRTAEQMKGQHCSSESSTYSSEQMGTPLSETLGTPQSVHAEIQDADYLSGSEDQLERNYLYCGPGQSPGRANSTKMKPESISTCSVTSPDNLSTKSDDSFQSIHANLPLETFAKLVSSDRQCPHLLVNALSQEELSTEIIVLQDAIDNEKAWTDSPELDNNSPKSPFNLENHTCVESVAKNTWADQGNAQLFPDAMKKSAPEKSPLRNHNDFGEEYYEKKDFPSVPAKVADATENSVVLSIEKDLEAATSSASYTSYSNTVANTTCSKSNDPFDWPDKNMTESCLRWKEIELTFHSSDLQKGLFQSKENKVDSQLDVPDVETPLENDSGEEFNKEVAEDMTYTEDGKADNEKWLEDTRDCYTEDDFNDIPDLPSQKESNLEPEDYSSLCDFSERKSFIYDESLPKPTRDSEALSSINTPESMENPSTEEKNDSAASPLLSGNSIILLGPTVETESKVKSWFESTIQHSNLDDLTEKSEKSIEVSSLETSSLMEVDETDLKVITNQLPIETEEKLEKKPQRGRRNLCKATETDESDFTFQNSAEFNAKVEMEVESAQADSVSSIMLFDKTPVTEPARMCTRSSTARVEPHGCRPGVGMKAPQQDKTKRGAFGEKERAPYKTGRRGGKNAVKILPTSNDQNLLLLQNKSPTILNTGQKSKENNISILKDERSMILRSRSKKQELFPAKRRRGKRGMNFVLKKRSSLKKIIANNCTASDAFQMMPKVRKRVKLSSSGVAINVKPTERPLHSLKRKSNLISPVPAKKRNLILHGKKAKEQKSETPSNLFKKIKPIKKEKVKLTIAAKKNCKVMLSAPSVRVAPDVCLKITSRSSYHGTMKTKVLPPRKGRGLKLEAIVQKMTSPNQKKQGVAIGGMTNGVLPNNNSNTLTQARELRDSSLIITDSETKMLSQEVTQIKAPKSEPEMHTASCRSSNNRSFKGKPLYKKKVTTNSLHGHVSTLTVAKPEGNCTSTKRPNVVPKKKSGRGRSKSSQSTSKTAAKKLLGASPSVLLTTRDKALSENALLAKKCLPNECKHLKLKEGSSLPDASEETLSQTRSRKKTKYPSFSSYTKRQRKCSPRNKSTSQTPTTKRRTKRQNIPHITPKEPEIKLKYVSCKPVRAESRVRFFSPYVQVEKRNAFTTTCTVINTAGEETRFLKDRSVVHSSSPSVPFDNQGSLPFSSRMQLGPLVCKSVSSGCLLCCLCRCPANYKDLGDLCGPYYPMDCLPNKKSRPKDKHQTEETLLEKSSKVVVVDSICTAGSGRTSCMDSGATDLVKHNTLRTSARGIFRKLPSCYCCNKKAEGTETEKPRKHQCSKTTELHSLEPETQEHWVHEACAVWTSGVYLVAGKLYGIHEAIQMAATALCPRCQKLGATVGCNHKGCTQTYHYVCATEAGCLLSEENFSLRCLKHKRHLV
ncbi:retinoic acid-induced protein 1 [Pseudophryne corroboree]|uniref:retinoic acid-induced protein 1 n=1 Tax=Pseudophryne corroboree TaxID=495146 RepID=UPI0030819835